MSAPSQSTSERLDQLRDVEAFPPPADFAAQAKVTDPGSYEQAAADAPAWWAGQARQRLHWQTPFQAALDDSNPPFYTWFADGALNASYNCLDRHVNAGHGDRVAFHWQGEQGEQRSLTYAEILADTQRLANALKAQGVRKGPSRPRIGRGGCGHRRARRGDRPGHGGLHDRGRRPRARPGPGRGTARARGHADQQVRPAAPVIWAADLPKTRSGKIMRRLLRDVADGRELGDVTTLGDPSVVTTLQKAAADGNEQ